MSAPTVTSEQSTDEVSAGTEQYPPNTPVWGLPPRQLAAGHRPEPWGRGAVVRYRPTEEAGTGVDTVWASDLRPRAEPDPSLDGSGWA